MISIPIPKGLSYLKGETVEEGIVVIDGYGNEFVWVPVENIDEFAVLKEGTTDYRGMLYNYADEDKDGVVEITENTDFVEPAVTGWDTITGNYCISNTILEDEYKDKELTLLDQFQTEFNKMVESVKKYGGFYVGRYETSWNAGINKVESKKEKIPMVGSLDISASGWSYDVSNSYKNITTTNWYGLYAKQKELYTEDTGVTSGMIWGCQWDAIMRWMKEERNEKGFESKLYILDSRYMGWGYDCGYGDVIQKTGLDGTGKNGTKVNNKVKNIYDLAGNVAEYTMACNDEYVNSREIRGSHSNTWLQGCPASYRSYGAQSGNTPRYSSRIQLYVK